MPTGRNAEYSHNVYPSTLFAVRSAITATAELLVVILLCKYKMIYDITMKTKRDTLYEFDFY